MNRQPEKGEAPKQVRALQGFLIQNANKERIMANSIAVPASNQPVFSFGDHTVRVVIRDGEPWFVATDVCAALDYKNTSKAVGDHLDEDERAAVLVPRTPNDSLGVPTNIINESGLYALVLRSRKPEARKFAKWVTSEVLPSIRKSGRYEKQILTTDNVNEQVAEWVKKIEAENDYPAMLFMPLVAAVQRKLGKRMIEMPPGQMLVDRKRLAALWVDLGKIRSRIDAMGCIESDFPPSWWAGKAIS